MINSISIVRQTGLALRTGFIMFTPRSTIDRLIANIEFLRDQQLLFSTVDLTTMLELYTGAAEVTRLKHEGLLTGDPWENPYAYRFNNERIGVMAHSLNKMKDSKNAGKFRWEALHTAKLIQAGVRFAIAEHQETSMKKIESEMTQNLDEMCHFLANQNYIFFRELLLMTEGKWSEREFDLLVKKHIHGYQTEIANTCTDLMKSYLIRLKNCETEVRF